MKFLTIVCCLLLSACGKDSERSLLLIEPVSGCQYVGTTYGDNPITSGSYIKPRTGADGEQICGQRTAS